MGGLGLAPKNMMDNGQRMRFTGKVNTSLPVAAFTKVNGPEESLMGEGHTSGNQVPLTSGIGPKARCMEMDCL